MKEFKRISFDLSFLCVIIILLYSNHSFAEYPIAESFSYPTDNYLSEISLGFGDYNSNYYCAEEESSKRHVAEDFMGPAGSTPVYAIGNGKVMFAQTRGTCSTNWGYVLVIEHILPNGNKVNSIYGHLDSSTIQVSEGEYVEQGTLLGNIGYFSCWGDHLHFGVYNGIYMPVSGTDLYPVWLTGYVCPSGFPGNYVDPTQFINEHRFYASFINHDPQGWTVGYDTEVTQDSDPDTWQVHVTGPNPGVVSPEYPDGLIAENYVVRFRARVEGNAYPLRGTLYIKDEYDSWNNPVNIYPLIHHDQNYHEYRVYLGEVYRPTLEIRQFSLELTEGGFDNEYWTFDWIRLERVENMGESTVYLDECLEDEPEACNTQATSIGGAGGIDIALFECIEDLEDVCYTGPIGTEGIGRCRAGIRTCQNGRWGTCQSQRIPNEEIFNGEDDDCDGEVDEGTTGENCCNPTYMPDYDYFLRGSKPDQIAISNRTGRAVVSGMLCNGHTGICNPWVAASTDPISPSAFRRDRGDIFINELGMYWWGMFPPYHLIVVRDIAFDPDRR